MSNCRDEKRFFGFIKNLEDCTRFSSGKEAGYKNLILHHIKDFASEKLVYYAQKYRRDARANFISTYERRSVVPAILEKQLEYMGDLKKTGVEF